MSDTVYSAVTAQIVSALESGVVPWRKPWREAPVPENAISKRPYRGVNLFLLGLGPFVDHRWVTLRQARELGGYVRKGQHSALVVFWKRWQIPDLDPENRENRPEIIPLLRYYRVFNVGQCEGLRLSPLPENLTRPEHDRIERAEDLVRSMPNPPRLHEGSRRACYYPLVDVVQIPTIGTFDSPDSYYATLLHELGHATGHVSRLGRKGVSEQVRFGSADYSREELVAELTSAFCCSHLGLDNSLIGNAASYIAGWLKVLKSDVKAIVVAGAQAQRAADYIRGIVHESREAQSEVMEVPA